MDIDQPAWEQQPDGSRTRIINGIRITLQPSRSRPELEHLVTWQDSGQMRILGLDRSCRPVYETSLRRLS